MVCCSSAKVDSSDETILILRKELQKCLGVVKANRTELAALRGQVDQKRTDELKVEMELRLLRERLEKCQVCVAVDTDVLVWQVSWVLPGVAGLLGPLLPGAQIILGSYTMSEEC